MPDLKISQLPVASATTGAELFPVVQGGVTKQLALNNIQQLGTLTSLAVSGNLTVDTNTLFVDSVNNAVGIGTTTPLASYLGKLAVEGNIAAGLGGKLYQFDSTNSTGRYMQAVASSGLAIGKYNAGGDIEQVRIDTNGNFGLGVTPSAASATTLQLPDGVTVSNAGTAASFAHNAVFNSGWKYVSTGAATLYQKYLGAHAWFTAPSGTAGNAISFTQAMTLDASGNLLVGPTSGVGGAKVAASGTFLSTTNTLSTFSGAYGGFDWTNRSLRVFAGTADATGSQIEFYAGVSGAINVKARIDNTATAGHTALLLWDVDNATLERVTVGAADSAGTGFKVLRIPN